MSSFLAILGVLTGGLVIWVSFGPRRARRAAEKDRERVRTLPTAALVAETRDCIRFAGFGEHTSARSIMAGETTTEAALLAKLVELLEVLVQEDATTRRRGPDSNYFMFVDCGLGHILEVLEARPSSSLK